MKSIIKKLIPTVYKKRLYHHYKEVFKKRNLDQYLYFEKRTPVFNLTVKHLQNLRAISTRYEMLELLPKNGNVAEIGVDEGNFSELILAVNNPRKLHLIDAWGSERYNKNKQKWVEEKFYKEIEAGTVEVNLGYSNKVVDIFPSSYFDWIYIDTSHTYEGTKEELEIYAPKMKAGGIIAGHDYIVGNWKGRVKYGVIEAVHEFCVNHNWEIVFLTMETRSHRSFAIKKLA